MSVFVLGAALLSAIAVAFVAWPLVRTRVGAPRAAGAAVLTAVVLIAAGAGLYLWLGDRGWSKLAQDSSSQVIPTLARHLERAPQDLDGWLALGRAYGTIGNYSLALRCFQRANRLASGGNAAALAGMAEAMLLGGDSQQADKAPEFLSRALQLDPTSPKALFYSAVTAYQQGRLDVARRHFETMLSLSPPQNIRVALQRQIDEIDKQLQASNVPVDVATAIHLHVTVSAALAAKIPADASLFVFVRSPTGGAPLAVKRRPARLPQDMDLSAADAMVAGHGVQPGQKVLVVARISNSGSPLPQSGDLSGEINCVAGKGGAQSLQIDKLDQ
jgi:cytochrome c-type biogenesis protein CcmH